MRRKAGIAKHTDLTTSAAVIATPATANKVALETDININPDSTEKTITNAVTKSIMTTNATYSKATTLVNNSKFATITDITTGVVGTISASQTNKATNIVPVTDTINSPVCVEMSTTNSFALNTDTIDSAIAEIAIVSNVVDVTALKTTCTADIATITMLILLRIPLKLLIM